MFHVQEMYMHPINALKLPLFRHIYLVAIKVNMEFIDRAMTFLF